jgi:hypothetical protein
VHALNYAAMASWPLGYPDRALEAAYSAIRLARELNHPTSLAFALYVAAWVHLLRREPDPLLAITDEIERLSSIYQIMFWRPNELRSWMLLEHGHVQEANAILSQIFPGPAHEWPQRYVVAWPFAIFALARLKLGDYDTAFAAIETAIEYAKAINENTWTAELYRLRGTFLLRRDDHRSESTLREAEACFLAAIEAARRQQARSWELRATISLAKLWQGQGNRTEAYQLLAPVYEWFTEGFDTPDMQEARALLAMLT